VARLTTALLPDGRPGRLARRIASPTKVTEPATAGHAELDHRAGAADARHRT
jgi:hypothetical protein